jgi:hypothetical protein
VSRRTRELAIRVTVGAQRRDLYAFHLDAMRTLKAD